MNRIALTFLLPAAIGLSSCHSGDKHAHKHEVKVSMADLPSAVRATLEKETAGGRITEIEKETKKGAVVYEAEATLDGKEWKFKIGEDGGLISKKLDKD